MILIIPKEVKTINNCIPHLRRNFCGEGRKEIISVHHIANGLINDSSSKTGVPDQLRLGNHRILLDTSHLKWSSAMQRRLKRQEGRNSTSLGMAKVMPSGLPSDLNATINSLQIPKIVMTELINEGYRARSAESLYPRTTENLNKSNKSTLTDLATDSYGRRHKYLRLSITDQCNFACQYCRPDGEVKFTPSSELMTPPEIAALVKMFIRCGIQKVRLTGGEPTFRPEFSEIVSTAIPSVSPIGVYAITSNGALLGRYLDVILESKVNQITLSLDSISSSTFESICKRHAFDVVWKTMLEIIERDFCLVKINCVVIRGVNDHEIINFIYLTEKLPIHIRFIEFMPFDRNKWSPDSVVPKSEILQRVSQHFGNSVTYLVDRQSDVADLFHIDGYRGCFGVISPISDIFCNKCDRIRVNSDGTIKNCLFSPEDFESVRPSLQAADEQKIIEIISRSIKQKKEKLGGADDAESLFARSCFNRPMTRIGG